ncbi:hypothetical protein F5X98DRAFT_353147 [Xylaria grammica]|nr:hypothetical protein F5X98DRAFT_353147 [Xylaria grammica]
MARQAQANLERPQSSHSSQSMLGFADHAPPARRISLILLLVLFFFTSVAAITPHPAAPFPPVQLHCRDWFHIPHHATSHSSRITWVAAGPSVN